MSKKVKILVSIMLILATLIIIAPKAQAAGLVIAFSKSTANVGDTVTVTVTGSGVTGSVNLSVSGNATLSQSTVWVENNSSSVNLKVNGEGNIRVTATAADMADSTTAAAYTGSTGGTITVSSNSSSTGNTSGESNTNTQTPSQPTTNSNNTTKSSNANLSNFGIKPNDFSGFTPSKTEYTTTVPNDVTSVEVYASKAQSGQKITGTGKKELQEGANTFKVVVTAEDGKTQKTYTLTVNRETANTEETPTEEKPEDGATEASEGFGLANLEIEGVKLSPTFSTDVFEYIAKYTGDESQLNIKTTPTEEGTNVEITGNENLVDGENVITILVTDSSGDKTVAYQLTVQKQKIDEEAIAKQEELEKQQQMRNYIIIGGVAFLILVIVIILIIRHRRNVRLTEEYTVPYSGLDNDDYYDNDNYENNYDEEDYEKVTKKFLNSNKNQEPIENSDKEKIKDSYLKQFDNQENNYEEDEKPRKRHNKGKRFR